MACPLPFKDFLPRSFWRRRRKAFSSSIDAWFYVRTYDIVYYSSLIRTSLQLGEKKMKKKRRVLLGRLPLDPHASVRPSVRPSVRAYVCAFTIKLKKKVRTRQTELIHTYVRTTI